LHQQVVARDRVAGRIGQVGRAVERVVERLGDIDGAEVVEKFADENRDGRRRAAPRRVEPAAGQRGGGHVSGILIRPDFKGRQRDRPGAGLRPRRRAGANHPDRRRGRSSAGRRTLAIGHHAQDVVRVVDHHKQTRVRDEQRQRRFGRKFALHRVGADRAPPPQWKTAARGRIAPQTPAAPDPRGRPRY